MSNKHRTAPQHQPLQLAREKLADAVNAFVVPQPVWIGGVCRWTDPLYARLRGALQPRNQVSRQRAPGERAPCRTDALVWLIEVDMTTAEWEPDCDGTIDRLRRHRDRKWTPDDTEQIGQHAEQIVGWTITAAELLGDKPPTVALRLPCPSCGTTHVRGRNGVGESVRRWALSISEDGARCAACDAEWSPEQFEFLARLLGCPALPA